MKNIGAQLYTVRDFLTTDAEIARTLGEIKEIGYTSVQAFGDTKLLESCARAAKKVGLDIVGILADLPTCKNCEKELFDICREYNISDIGVSAGFTDFQKPEPYISEVNAFAKKAVTAGFTFSYHNHGAEFIRLDDGKTAMEHFLEEFDPEVVDFMPDTYWLHDGGYDVRRFLEQTKNRVKILHLKDLKRTMDGHIFTEVGSGNLYFEGILKIAVDNGVTNFVVEQDICEGNPMDSLKKSFAYVKGLLEG